MRGFLLDTNVLTALRRPADNPSVVDFIRAQPADHLHTSEVTVAEIRFGIELVQDPSRRADLQLWLDRTMRPLFADRIHGVTEEVLVRWLLIDRDGRRRGHTYSQQDALVAGIAASDQLIVVSRDETHFVAAHVPTLDPWNARFFAADGTSHAVPDLVSATLLTQLSG